MLFHDNWDVLKLYLCRVTKLWQQHEGLCTCENCVGLCLGRFAPFFNVFASTALWLEDDFLCSLYRSFFAVAHIHKNLSNRYKSKLGSAAWMLVLGILCDKKRKISLVPPFVLDPTLPRSGPRMPAKWLDSSSSDVSDKVADFPLVLARGHCAKIIDVRACAANAYLPSRARHQFSAHPGN